MIRDNCKNILCFGDSNTFGSNPSGGRWDRTKRWPGRLQQLLGEDYYVIEEGCGGRTTSFDDTLELDKNGRRALPVALARWPLDLVIIMRHKRRSIGFRRFRAMWRMARANWFSLYSVIPMATHIVEGAADCPDLAWRTY
ncbi:MAG: GDSL-type esterase/lipase family protein [Christensenellales bacterium]